VIWYYSQVNLGQTWNHVERTWDGYVVMQIWWST
jgi:hypothetical protein